METGMNRHEKWQIAQDLFNQEFMRLSLQAMLHGVDVDPQNEFSIGIGNLGQVNIYWVLANTAGAFTALVILTTFDLARKSLTQ